MQIQIPEKVKYVVETITAAGFEAYVVGGCVRDSILGRKPEDWDITTSAEPEQVKAIFDRTIDTGIAHGTVTVMLGKEGFEVTTYRIDGKYEDSRHPSQVTFTPSLEEDLKRRDFTINAMAYNDSVGLVDLFGGIEDIGNRIIRCVGNAEARFGEDALRIMRAIRFSAQLDYEIEEETRDAVRKLAGKLREISAERIQTELCKLLVSNHPDRLRTAYELGVTEIVLPEFDRMMETGQNSPHHDSSVGEHTLKGLLQVEADKVLRLAMLFHDAGKPDTRVRDEKGIDHFCEHTVRGEEIARNVLKRLRFDNDTLGYVTRLVRWHDYGIGQEPELRMVRRAVNRIGEDIMPLLFAVQRADILAQNPETHCEKLERLEQWQAFYRQILEEGHCTSLKTLAVTGKDLIASGMKPGKELGELLHWLLDQVLENPENNTREWLIARAETRTGFKNPEE